DFPLLFHLGLAPAVVQLDDIERFDEERLAACRCVVHDALDDTPGLGAHGDDVPAVPHRDDAFLQGGAIATAGHEALQAILEPAMRDPDRLPDPGEFLAGSVEHIATRTDRPAEVGLKWREILDRFGELEHVRIAMRAIRQALEEPA